MKAIMVMFDSLNRRMLPAYGCDWVHAPNFRRLAERSVTFDNAYVGSMPCMPARREIHTGRHNFLHRAWGPLEPFDDSMPEMLKQAGIYTHLVSDHYHYWEEGGANYHTRYNSWEISRGQEGDPWKANLAVTPPPSLNVYSMRQPSHYWMNQEHLKDEADAPQAKTFANGLEFIRTNAEADKWFLHIETFDPHEPFVVPQRYIDLYDEQYDGPHYDWPECRLVQERQEEVKHIRTLNAALVSMCDHYLCQVLDLMDEHNLWDDTLLIVNTDHGYLLAEHDCWAKCWCPWYNELANTPLFVWDPRLGLAGQRRAGLVQTIDLAPTLLEFFGLDRTKDMMGQPLLETLRDDTPIRDAALFGMYGAQVNVTDGRYVYMRAAASTDNKPLYQYTHMPCHMTHTFPVSEMRTAVMAPPFSFTKGCQVMRIDGSMTWGNDRPGSRRFENLLFDLQNDPGQLHPLDDPAVEKYMIDVLIRKMREAEAPAEQYVRLGLAEAQKAGERHEVDLVER